MPKLTFSLDAETVAALTTAARRTGKPQSLIVREAIAQHTASEARLSDKDRERLLSVLKRVGARPATRSATDVDRELKEVRRGRRTGWSRSTK